jgi:hypothetical protein
MTLPEQWRHSDPGVDEPAARGLLWHAVDRGLEVRLLTDSTKIGSGHQLLMVSPLYRRRANRMDRTWANSDCGYSSVTKQRALPADIHGLLPAGVAVTVTGDSEFGSVAVLK